MKNLLFTVCLLVLGVGVQAQKKPLDHSVYDTWKSLHAPALTDDGRYFSYEIRPQEGDGQLIIRETKTGKEM